MSRTLCTPGSATISARSDRWLTYPGSCLRRAPEGLELGFVPLSEDQRAPGTPDFCDARHASLLVSVCITEQTKYDGTKRVPQSETSSEKAANTVSLAVVQWIERVPPKR